MSPQFRDRTSISTDLSLLSKVVPVGIEPTSSESESEILSIVLRNHFHYFVTEASAQAGFHCKNKESLTDKKFIS